MGPLKPLTLFDPAFDVPSVFKGMLPPMWMEMERMPPVIKLDVEEAADRYLVKADMPGVTKDDIHVDVDGNMVTISAEVRREKKDEKEGKQQAYGSAGIYPRSVGSEPVAVDVAMIRQKQSAKGKEVVLMNDGEVLKDGGANKEADDRFKIVARVNCDCYLYIITIDGSGWAEPVFPVKEGKTPNPVKKDQEYAFPEEGQWYTLDEVKGLLKDQGTLVEKATASQPAAARDAVSRPDMSLTYLVADAVSFGSTAFKIAEGFADAAFLRLGEEDLKAQTDTEVRFALRYLLRDRIEKPETVEIPHAVPEGSDAGQDDAP